MRVAADVAQVAELPKARVSIIEALLILMSFSLAASILVQALALAPDTGADPLIERARVIARRDCLQAEEAELVVCGSRSEQERYRLPLRDEQRSGDRFDRRAGDLPRASLETSNAPCGIFEGQRRCSKADAAEFGYGNGRDPLTLARRIFDAAADPE